VEACVRSCLPGDDSGDGGDDIIGGGVARRDLITSGPGREGKGRPGLQW
jgi:hypothetical protein